MVTGCTRGIGLCYAHELAKRGINLILIGRNSTRLRNIASDLQVEYENVEIEIIEMDFGDRVDAFNFLIKDGLAGKDIGILVNNVGVISPYPMYFNEVSHLKYYLHSHLCRKFRPCFRSCFHPLFCVFVRLQNFITNASPEGLDKTRAAGFF